MRQPLHTRHEPLKVDLDSTIHSPDLVDDPVAGPFVVDKFSEEFFRVEVRLHQRTIVVERLRKARSEHQDWWHVLDSLRNKRAFRARTARHPKQTAAVASKIEVG